MESIEKLRELAADINSTEIIDHLDVVGKFMFHHEWLDSWHKAFDAACDEIEREIAERYMELPLDADGVPIKMGDEVVIPQCYEGIVVSIEIGNMETLIGVDGHDGYLRYGNSDIRHFKQRTVEDVMRDVWEEAIDYAKSVIWRAPEEVFTEYAAEIRELMGVGE